MERIRKLVGLPVIVLGGHSQTVIKTHIWSSSSHEPVLSCLLSAHAVAINGVWWTVSSAAISWRTETSQDMGFSPPSLPVCFSFHFWVSSRGDFPVLALEKMWMFLCRNPHVTVTWGTCTVLSVTGQWHRGHLNSSQTWPRPAFLLHQEAVQNTGGRASINGDAGLFQLQKCLWNWSLWERIYAQVAWVEESFLMQPLLQLQCLLHV